MNFKSLDHEEEKNQPQALSEAGSTSFRISSLRVTIHPLSALCRLQKAYACYLKNP